MKNLSQIVGDTKGLTQVAQQIKNVALFYAPKDTGRLKRAINSANKPASMWKVRARGDSFKVTFALTTSPSDAPYGQWWNSPTVSWQVQKGGNPKNIDFGKKGFTDKSTKDEYKKFLKNVTNELLDDFTKRIDTSLKKIYVK